MQANSKRYSSGKFIVSVPGVLKIFAIIFLLASSIVFLNNPLCTGTPSWYPTLYPITAASSGVLVAILYAFFASGLVKRFVEIWSIIDLIFNVLDFIIMLTVSILTTVSCAHTGSTIQLAPGPMGMLAALLLAISSIVYYKNTRSTKEVVLSPERDVKPINVNQYRKSVIV